MRIPSLLRSLSHFSITPLLLALAITGFTGCAGKPVDENDPASLMEEVEGTIKSDHFQLAIDKLRLIKNKFPYSKQASDAQIRIGDVYFMQESFIEAAVSYETFRDLHPKHERTGYALYRIGLSYYNDLPSTEARDFSLAQKALGAFDEYLTLFPQGEFAEETRKLRGETLSRMANKELYVADFYARRGYYDSAARRLKKLISAYPGTVAAQSAEQRLTAYAAKKSKNENFIPSERFSSPEAKDEEEIQ